MTARDTAVRSSQSDRPIVRFCHCILRDGLPIIERPLRDFLTGESEVPVDLRVFSERLRQYREQLEESPGEVRQSTGIPIDRLKGQIKPLAF